MTIAVMFGLTAFIMYHLLKMIFIVLFNVTGQPGLAMVTCFFAAKPLLIGLALPMTFWLMQLPAPA